MMDVLKGRTPYAPKRAVAQLAVTDRFRYPLRGRSVEPAVLALVVGNQIARDRQTTVGVTKHLLAPFLLEHAVEHHRRRGARP